MRHRNSKNVHAPPAVNHERVSSRELAVRDSVKTPAREQLMAHSVTTGPLSATDPRSHRRQLLLRWVHPPSLLPALDLSSPVIDIGRDPSNHVIVQQPSTSRHHARIERRGQALGISDRGSKNGVFVDGLRVESAPLLVGSVVRVGELVGVVHEQARDAPEQPRELLPGLIGSGTLALPLELARRVASSTLAVLILGESGTGKELVARAIHEHSQRPGPFVAVNCAALSESLLDAELFGHERGAFTGAERARPGFIRAAEKGTLFLDEVGELSAAAQAKLLRVLEERAVTPVGGWSATAVDFRLLGATHRPLPELAASGGFRADLFARMEGAVLRLPALRERREDVPVLFGALAAAALGRRLPRLSARLVERLCVYDWPRNVRELRQVAHRLAALHPGEPEWRCRHLGGALPGSRPSDPPVLPESGPVSRARGAPSLPQLEAALGASFGNVAAAARQLGVSKQTLYRWLSQHGVALERFRNESGGRR
jgi:sigma-54 dependent transcriptional regulator, acetoin dehydrogenase operon transcriptional activator AcoR